MAKKIKKLLISQEEFDKKFFYGDTEAIKLYIRESLKEYTQDHDRKSLFESLFTAIKWSGITKFAKKIGMSRSGLYDALIRKNANPSFDTLERIFRGLNIRLNFDITDIEDEPKEYKSSQQYQYAY